MPSLHTSHGDGDAEDDDGWGAATAEHGNREDDGSTIIAVTNEDSHGNEEIKNGHGDLAALVDNNGHENEEDDNGHCNAVVVDDI